MSKAISLVKDAANPKVYRVFEKLAGKKLDKASELTMKLFNEEEKQLERAMADSLETLGLV